MEKDLNSKNDRNGMKKYSLCKATGHRGFPSSIFGAGRTWAQQCTYTQIAQGRWAINICTYIYNLRPVYLEVSTIPFSFAALSVTWKYIPAFYFQLFKQSRCERSGEVLCFALAHWGRVSASILSIPNS